MSLLSCFMVLACRVAVGVEAGSRNGKHCALRLLPPVIFQI